MSLDLGQNIVIYLSLLTTIVSIILLFRVISISKNQRTTNKTLLRLKYEINKMQEIDSALVKSLTNEEPVYSWFEEDELKREKLNDRSKRNGKQDARKSGSYEVNYHKILRNLQAKISLTK